MKVAKSESTCFDLFVRALHYSQAFFVWAGSSKAKASVRDNRYHDSGYQLALVTQAVFLRLCSGSHKVLFGTSFDISFIPTSD